MIFHKHQSTQIFFDLHVNMYVPLFFHLYSLCSFSLRMKTKRESPLLPHSKELSKRRRSSLNLIRMSLARLSRLCTERELVLFSSSDELGSYPLRRLARRSAAAFSSEDLSSSKMSSSSSR